MVQMPEDYDIQNFAKKTAVGKCAGCCQALAVSLHDRR